MTPPRHLAVRKQVRAALWLQSRDLVHLGGRRRLGPALIAGYAAFCGLLIVGGIAAHQQAAADVSVGRVFTPIWLLWALLPAVGAGGGSLDETAALAPYPVGTPTLLAASWFSALTDAQYLVTVPFLLIGATVQFGVAGLPAAVVFLAGASALGQLAGWLSIAGVRARQGQSLLVTAVAVIGLGALAVARRSHTADARRLGTIPPARWLGDAAQATADGRWAAALGWTVLLAAPIGLLALCGPMLVRRAMLARLAGPAPRTSSGALGGTPARALAVAAWRCIVRTVSWRATLLAVVAVPFLTTLLSEPLTYRSLVVVSLVSAGATIAANTWSYEAGGVTLLLSAPLPRGLVVIVRTAVLAAALATALALATAAALVAGPLRADPGDVGFAACATVLVAVAGMRTSIATASAADVDSLRARPATLPAVFGFAGRCLLPSVLLSALWMAGVVGVVAGVLLMAGYGAWALRGTRRRLADGASLLAAFATVR
jgi:hypothetical protein